ncbi:MULTISPECIES: efflux transporter outer membrane subunit [unclassified Achromobacter]|uniref:efflux transporter outer membrane subunit n=1 Tax=unclassified Achromobacter TaxID=2626865 RepID=UPI001E38B487|nr:MULTISPECIES: efflux transporter outer membrane subunit [unclassified Achromobacter]
MMNVEDISIRRAGHPRTDAAPALAGLARAVRLAGLIGAALLCAACTVGPDFKSPDAGTPADYADRQRAPQPPVASVTQNTDPDPQWWHGFNDPVLDSLIDRAIAGNLTLRQAVLRIVAARQQARAAGARGLPQINGTGSYTYQKLGAKGILESRGIPGKIDRLGDADSPLNDIAPDAGAQASSAGKQFLDEVDKPVNLYMLGVDASWELDLFGRVRRGVEAANAQTESALEDRNDALVSLEAEVARTYATLRGAQLLDSIAREEVRVSQDTLDLTRSRQQSGLASQTDVERADAQLGAVAAQLPQFEQQAAQALNALALLLGQPPGTLDAELSSAGGVPPVPPVVPVGLPASLARRRPDIRRAEADLHAATAQVGESIAELFPDLSLTGQFGFRATQASYLTRWASHFYSVGPQVSLPIFQGGALRAQVAIAKADQAASVLNYRQTVLSALRDVDDALVRYRTDQARQATLQRVTDANARAFDLARNGWRNGLNSFIDVLDTERQLSDSRVQLAQQQVQVTTDLVALYKSLGGGWQGHEIDPARLGDAAVQTEAALLAGEGAPKREDGKDVTAPPRVIEGAPGSVR